MRPIRDGVLRYSSEVHPRHGDLFADLAGGQRPDVLFITCSDSRIDPALITQSEPGQLFVVRNAGNVVPPLGAPAGGEVATIEYAIRVLGIPHVVVCGHAHCGAMAALRSPATVEHLPAVRAWLEAARPALVRDGGYDRADGLAALIERNVRQQIDNLRSYDFIREAEAAGHLSLDGWVYDFEHGDVFELDAATGRFEPIHAPATAEVASGR